MLVSLFRLIPRVFAAGSALCALLMASGCAVSPQPHEAREVSFLHAAQAEPWTKAHFSEIFAPRSEMTGACSEDAALDHDALPREDEPAGPTDEHEESLADWPTETFNPLGMAALERALEQIGVPYRRGGTGPGGFDCSGLVRFAFAQVGVELPHGASRQQQMVEPIAVDELQPGDLVFFRVRGRHIDHVGIYLDGSEFVHAPSPGKRVSIADLDNAYWQKRLAGAGRISDNL